ncbi:hypothetical protein [Brevibacterium litoralis]|uniref:hypothetical protein n=1 Tax=Brevibacterium litoralis TaxID=3138935 RepID=UPI0032EDFDFD
MTSQHGTPSHTILHISDTHFVEDDALLHDKVDSDANLKLLFERLRASSITPDSTVPGHHHGELTDEQLDWLAEELTTPAEHGTLVGLHHPPVPSPLGLIELVELKDQERFARVIEGTDVRGVLGGHLHYNTTSTFAGGIPVSVASATCYTQDLQVVFPGACGMDGAQGYNLVHVYEDRVLHTVVPIAAHPTVYEMTPEILQAFMEKSAEEQAAMVDAANRTEDSEQVLAGASAGESA